MSVLERMGLVVFGCRNVVLRVKNGLNKKVLIILSHCSMYVSSSINSAAQLR